MVAGVRLRGGHDADVQIVSLQGEDQLDFRSARYAGSGRKTKHPRWQSSHADVLKDLAFCFKLVNTNAHDDPAAARRILSE